MFTQIRQCGGCIRFMSVQLDPIGPKLKKYGCKIYFVSEEAEQLALIDLHFYNQFSVYLP